MNTVVPIAPPDPDGARIVQEVDALLQEYQQPDPAVRLGKFVQSAFQAAADHRRGLGVDEQMRSGLRAVLNEYDPDVAALLGDDASIYVGLTNVKVRALQSWLTDILANVSDKPWTLQPTPSPELSAADREIVVQQLAQEVAAQGIENQPEIVMELARHMKAAQKKYADKLAEAAVSRMEQKIEDHLLEGGWRDALAAFFVDLSIYPSAVMKAPVLKEKKTLRWIDGQPVPVSELVYGVERVSPFDIFPAPNAVDPQTGAYIIERRRMSPSALDDAKRMVGFQPTVIDALRAVHPAGYKDGVVAEESEHAQLEIRANLTKSKSAPDSLYDVIIYYGKVPGRHLMEMGIDVADMTAMYEAEVWVCAGYTLRAILNPHPLGRRPFHATSFDKIPGSFWGRSLPSILSDPQRMVNAAARALARNMPFSSAPVSEVDVDRLVDEEDITSITPYRVYLTSNDAVVNSNQPVFRFHQIPDNAGSLLKVQDYYTKLADDVSGIPAYVIGNPNVAGAGRTLGGLSLLMGNAAKGVKKVIGNIDRDVIEPLVSSLFELLMMFDPDTSIKADAKVVARGASGILQRELSQSRAVETLQMLTPYVQLGIVPPIGLQVLLRQIMQSLGYSDNEIVPDPDRQNALALQAQQAQIMAQAAQGAQGGGGAIQAPAKPGAIDFRAQIPATPPPTLDNRSATPPPPGAADQVPPQL